MISTDPEPIITKFHTRLLAHMRDLCPFPISIIDAIKVDEYCIKHRVNPNLATLKVIFADRFSEYKLNKKKNRNWR